MTQHGGSGRLRVVVAQPGPESEDLGARTIARALRDAGMEVIYTGLQQTPERILETALQEDADAVCVSVQAGNPALLVTQLADVLRQQHANDVLLTVSAPASEAAELRSLQIAAVFQTGAPLAELVAYVAGTATAART